jgi:hypothetical protein
MFKLRILGLSAFALLATAAMGQPVTIQSGHAGMVSMAGGYGGRLMLLTRKDVQNDLQLTAGQLAKVSDLQGSLMPRTGGFAVSGSSAGGGPAFQRPSEEEIAAREAEEKQAVAALLSKSQAKRLDEINIQLQGNMSVMDPDVQKALNITDDQKDRIHSAIESAHESIGPIAISGDGPPDIHEIQAHMKQMQDTLNNAVGSVLTAPQKATLKRLAGAPFKRTDPDFPQIHVRTSGGGL